MNRLYELCATDWGPTILLTLGFFLFLAYLRLSRWNREIKAEQLRLESNRSIDAYLKGVYPATLSADELYELEHTTWR